MFKDSSAKYYQNNIERLQKKLVKDIKVFLKRNKKKSNNIVVNNRKKIFSFRKSTIILKS